jgi:hypothetical protein
MDVRQYRPGPEATLVADDGERGADGASAGEAMSLVVLSRPTPEVLEAWLTPLGLSRFAVNRLCQPTNASHVIPLSRAVIVELRVLSRRSDNALCFVSLLLLDDRLVVIDESDGADAASSPLSQLEAMEITDASPTGLLSSVLLHLLAQTSDRVRTLRLSTLAADDGMEADPDSMAQEELTALRNRLLRVLAVCEEQLACVESLEESDASSTVLDFSRLKGSHSLILAMARTSERMAARLEKRLDGLRERLEARQQDSINQRLQVLTVLSAVFLPLTLLAGIWGMNFQHMPELALPYGYPAALSLMGVCAGGLLLYFWKQGWFGKRK